MSILGQAASAASESTPSTGPAPAERAPLVTETPAPRVSARTQSFLERLEAAKQVMALMRDEQNHNLEMARQFAELAKATGWPQQP